MKIWKKCKYWNWENANNSNYGKGFKMKKKLNERNWERYCNFQIIDRIEKNVYYQLNFKTLELIKFVYELKKDNTRKLWAH